MVESTVVELSAVPAAIAEPITEPITEPAARAELLSCVANPVRLSLLDRLAALGTRCVCDLQTDPPTPGNLLSYHLKVLRDAGLVTTARRGRWVDYTLAPDALDRLRAALPAATQTGSEP